MYFCLFSTTENTLQINLFQASLFLVLLQVQICNCLGCWRRNEWMGVLRDPHMLKPQETQPICTHHLHRTFSKVIWWETRKSWILHHRNCFSPSIFWQLPPLWIRCSPSPEALAWRVWPWQRLPCRGCRQGWWHWWWRAAWPPGSLCQSWCSSHTLPITAATWKSNTSFWTCILL